MIVKPWLLLLYTYTINSVYFRSLREITSHKWILLQLLLAERIYLKLQWNGLHKSMHQCIGGARLRT